MVSIPDDVFETVERLARRARRSRSGVRDVAVVAPGVEGRLIADGRTRVGTRRAVSES